MNTKISSISAGLIALSLGVSALAADLSTTDGATYKNVTKQRVDPDGLYIEYTPEGGGMGVAKVKFSRLSKDFQKKCGYDESVASDYEDQYEKGMAVWRADMAQMEKARKEAQASQYADQVRMAQAQALKNEQMLQGEQQTTPTASDANLTRNSLTAALIPHVDNLPPPSTRNVTIVQPYIGLTGSHPH